jgi:hypothetical protein
VWQLGQIFVVACPGEPYSFLQTEIRRRCRDTVHVLVLANTNGSLSHRYLLPTPAPAPNSCGWRCSSPTDADFLDLHFYKGSLWRQSSHLDVKLFAKSSNAYLYKTFDSSAPRSQFIGVIYGELIRLVKRNSDPANFHTAVAAVAAAAGGARST